MSAYDDSAYQDLVSRHVEISRHPHISLLSYAPDGVGVPTVIALAPYSGRFVTRLPEHSGTAERIAHSPAVFIAPCDSTGALLRNPFPATARIMASQELPVVTVALAAKYGWWYRLRHSTGCLGRLLHPRRFRQVGVELTVC
ncbi:MAG: hypothetical protein ACRDPW_05765 [Mycobacteriales bacterium]